MLKNRLDGHFLACGALAATGAMAGLAQQADAGIVYSGTVNIPIQQTTNGLYINIVTGQINEPGNGTGGTVPGWDINPYGATLSTFYGFGNAGYTFVPSAGAVAALAAGALIDGTTSTGTSSASASNFTPGVGAYYGFRFTNEAMGNALQYAWALVIRPTGASPATGTLVSYAYEDTGAGINAGAVPTPGSLALLAVGAAGLAGRRRR